MPRLRWLNNFRFALRAQRRHLTRTALALLGIIVGVAAVIIMVSMGRGTQAQVYQQIVSMGLNRLTVSAAEIRAPAGQANSRVLAETLTLRDVRALTMECKDALFIVPLQVRRLPVKYGNLNRAAGVVGTTSDFFLLRSLQTIHGRTFHENEQAGAIRSAVLGYDVASALFPTGALQNALYETIRINGISFEVIGILEQRGINPDGSNDDEQIFIPLNTALRRVFNISHLNQVLVQAPDPQSISSLEAEISSILRRRHSIRGLEKDDFEVESQLDLIKTEQETAQQLQFMIAAIAAVSFLVGGVGILAVMLLTLKDRIREVGVRRAVGAKRRSILSQFVIEATTLSFGGSLAGTCLGGLGAYLASRSGGWPFILDGDLVVLAAGSAMLVGIVFGIYPALRAARLDPILALRSE